jgi:hypothetical protein
VHSRGSWNISNNEPSVTKPSTQISVLPIQKIPFVKSIDDRQSVPLRHDASARHPVDELAGSHRAVIHHHVSLGNFQERKDTSQHRCAAEETGQYVGIASRATLHRAVRIEHTRADQPTRRVHVQLRLQSAERASH